MKITIIDIKKEVVDFQKPKEILERVKLSNLSLPQILDEKGDPSQSTLEVEAEKIIYRLEKIDDNVNGSRYIKVKRDLNKSKNIKMLLLLERPIMHINRLKQLKELIEGQGLF